MVLVHDVRPELRAFALLDPQAQNDLGAVGEYARREVGHLVAAQPLVAEIGPHSVEESEGIGGDAARPARQQLPEHSAGDGRYKVRRACDAIQIALIPGDLPSADAEPLRRYEHGVRVSVMIKPEISASIDRHREGIR